MFIFRVGNSFSWFAIGGTINSFIAQRLSCKLSIQRDFVEVKTKSVSNEKCTISKLLLSTLLNSKKYLQQMYLVSVGFSQYLRLKWSRRASRVQFRSDPGSNLAWNSATLAANCGNSRRQHLTSPPILICNTMPIPIPHPQSKSHTMTVAIRSLHCSSDRWNFMLVRCGSLAPETATWNPVLINGVRGPQSSLPFFQTFYISIKYDEVPD